MYSVLRTPYATYRRPLRTEYGIRRTEKNSGYLGDSGVDTIAHEADNVDVVSYRGASKMRPFIFPICLIY